MLIMDSMGWMDYEKDVWKKASGLDRKEVQGLLNAVNIANGNVWYFCEGGNWRGIRNWMRELKRTKKQLALKLSDSND